jgi:hypothetical protein
MHTTRHLIHPACNLLFAQRLHYVFLDVPSNFEEASVVIRRSVRTLHLQDSTCAYFVYGETDILLRIWSDEETLHRLLHEFILREIPGAEYRILLVTNQSTWFQRELEKRSEWGTALEPEKLQGVLSSGNIPDNLKLVPEATEPLPVKFFMLVEDVGLRNLDIYNEMRQEMEAGGDKFGGLERLSLYAYETSAGRGILLKGESADFSLTANRLHTLGREVNLKHEATATTTYFRSARISESEESSVSDQLARLAKLERHEICLNFLRSILTPRQKLEQDHDSHEMSRTFIAEFDKWLIPIFSLRSKWDELLPELRQLFLWTVRREQKLLRAFYLEFFINLEREVRKLFHERRDWWEGISGWRSKLNAVAAKLDIEPGRLFKAWDEVFANNSNQGEKFTLQAIRACLSRCGKLLENKQKGELLRQFSAAFESHDSGEHSGIIEVRNDLMHGSLMDLYERDTNGRMGWTRCLAAYLAGTVLKQRCRGLIEEALKKAPLPEAGEHVSI